jgi:hypothetical protein
MLYELDEQIQPVSRRFLGDPAVLAAAQDAGISRAIGLK